eukprot:m51a1_g13426 hypothetical protein (218) ;mRNA; f:1083-1891
MHAFVSVIVLAAACTASALNIAFTGNVSAEAQASVDLQYRSTGLFTLPAVRGVIMHSLDARIAADVLAGKTIDAKVAASAVGAWAYGGALLNTPPSAWYGSFKADLNLAVDTSLLNLLNADVSGSLGFAGMMLSRLVERNAAGTQVLSKSLGELTWRNNGNGESSNIKGAHWFRLLGTDSTTKLTVAVTYIVSDIVGVLDYAKVPLLLAVFVDSRRR